MVYICGNVEQDEINSTIKVQLLETFYAYG